MLSEMPSGRPMVCVATRNPNEGESAPSEATIGASQLIATIILRRPKRSAENANGNAITTPQRTMAAAKPWPRSLTSNSAAAYVAVCVKTVLTNDAGKHASHSNHSTFR